MTNGGVSPFKMVRFNNQATNTATTIPMKYIRKKTKLRELKIHGTTVKLGMNALVNNTYTGIRALQLINGATNIVIKRSRRFSITRAAMIPGTAHANDESNGINDLPFRPMADIDLSIR